MTAKIDPRPRCGDCDDPHDGHGLLCWPCAQSEKAREVRARAKDAPEVAERGPERPDWGFSATKYPGGLRWPY